MKILVTGGTGYIGSITVKKLMESGHIVTVFDNVIHGNKNHINTELIVGDLEDKTFLFDALDSYTFDAVIHFAAYAIPSESMKDPYKYFSSNIIGGLNLLDLMRIKRINHIIFSSSCAVYGMTRSKPFVESSRLEPLSVYGESKIMFEHILDWYDRIYGIKSIKLRYFNASGGSLDGNLGELHTTETHIIPNVIKAALSKRPFILYGTDYPTPDGTCIRDYIHVEDLAEAHIQALTKIRQDNKSDTYNLGSGTGYSNMQIINKVKEITGLDIAIRTVQRRKGDPAVVLADVTKASEKLGFYPKYSDLDTIIRTAWNWHKTIL